MDTLELIAEYNGILRKVSKGGIVEWRAVELADRLSVLFTERKLATLRAWYGAGFDTDAVPLFADIQRYKRYIRALRSLNILHI